MLLLKRRKLILVQSIVAGLSAFVLSSAVALAADYNPSVRSVGLADAELMDQQQSTACPKGICPGIGNMFYLPSINSQSIQTGGGAFFKDRTLGTCSTIYKAAQNSRSFYVSDSMEHFVTSTMAEANVGGTYESKVLSASGTASAMTDSSSDSTSTFHSTTLDITAVTHSINFTQNPTCFSQQNLHPDFLKNFESLAMIDLKEVSSSAQWSPYVQFLKSSGSHILMQQYIGSRFQQWESSTSSDLKIEDTLKAKACAEVEGTQPGGGWSVNGCAAYSSHEKREALKSSSKSVRVIKGGTVVTRAGLTKQVDKANLDAFIDSAEQGDQPIMFMYSPVWELLNEIYLPACHSEGNASDACKNLQRATNLQAAYEGWTAVGCTKEKTNDGYVYQEMVTSGPTTQGIYTYACTLAKTGCRKDDDCHLGGAGSVCYCYGSSCIGSERKSFGGSKDMHRNIVVGNKSGSYDEGVNNSCYYKFIAHCDCNKNWSGGYGKRNVYDQSAP